MKDKRNMRYIIFMMLFYSIFFLSSAQNQKYIRYYKKKEFEKSLSECEKYLKKNKTDTLALLYKALSIIEMGIEGEKDKVNASEKALTVIEKIYKLDKTKRFTERHHSEMMMVFAKIRSMTYPEIYNTDVQKAKEILYRILALNNYKDNYFTLGKIELLNYEKISGMRNVNNYLSIVNREFKKGINPDSVVFKNLIELVYIFKELSYNKNAFDVFAFINMIFKYHPEAELIHLKLLNEYIEKGDFKWNSNLVAYNNFCLDAFHFYHKPELQKLRWQYLDSMLAYSYINGIFDIDDEEPLSLKRQIISILDSSENKNSDRKEIEKILIYYYSSFLKNKITFKSDILYSLIFLINSIDIQKCTSPDENVFNLLKNIQASFHFTEYAAILYNTVKHFPSDKTIKKMVKDFENVLIDHVSNDLLRTDILTDLITYAEWFPEYKNYNLLLKNKVVTYYDNCMMKGAYSDAVLIFNLCSTVWQNDKKISDLKKDLAIKDYRENYLGSFLTKDELGWTGNVEQCKAGTISESAKRKVLQRINYFRRQVGMPDSCVLLPELDLFAQEAALIMHANSTLNHFPETSYKCYSKTGYLGASHSNLTIGRIGSDAISTFMEDFGENNYSVGHRRWIMNPLQKAFGFGSTTGAAALLVITDSEVYPGSSKNLYFDFIEAETTKNKFYCWPPEGYVPYNLVYSRWSFSLSGASFDSASVKMTSNGLEIPLSVNKVAYGYSLPTLVWEVPSAFITRKEQTIEVKLTDVRVYGIKKEFSYRVTIFDEK